MLGQQILPESTTTLPPVPPFPPQIPHSSHIRCAWPHIFAPLRAQNLGRELVLTVAVPRVDLPALELEVEQRHVGVVGVGVVAQLGWGRRDGRTLPT